MGIVERKKRERQLRRRQILDAARQTFNQLGYRQATVSEIAEAAELSTGTIYSYFKNKEGLFLTLVMEVFHEFNQKLEDSGRRVVHFSLNDRIETLCRTLIDIYEENPKVIRLLFNLHDFDSFNLTPEHIPSRMAAPLQDMMKSIGHYIEKHLPEITLGRSSHKAAKLILSQFIGCIQVNQLLKNGTMERRVSLLEDLKSWVLAACTDRSMGTRRSKTASLESQSPMHFNDMMISKRRVGVGLS